MTGDGFAIALDGAKVAAAQAQNQRQVTLGIRPSDLTYAPEAAAETALAKTKKAMDDGVFRIDHLPGVGRVTEKEVEARLTAVETEIEKIKAARDVGEYKIHRPSVGWATRKSLEKALDDGEASFQTMKKTVSDGLFTVHIAGVGGGWWDRSRLEEKVKAMDKAIADTNAAIRKGDYSAQVYGGWNSLNHLKILVEANEKRLKDPNLKVAQRNQIAEQLEALHKAMKEWRDLSAMDLTIKGFEKTKFLAWVGTILKLAKPDFEHRALIRDERIAHLTSFKPEAELRLMPLEHERDRLLMALDWFVGD